MKSLSYQIYNQKKRQINNQEQQTIDLAKDAWKFVPKHLVAIKNAEKQGYHKNGLKQFKSKNLVYEQTTSQIINRNKNYYLAPVRDIEKIMKHFNNKFSDDILKTNSMRSSINDQQNKKARKKTSLLQRKRLQTQHRRVQNQPQLIQKKIKNLLQLPSLKLIKSQAKRLKSLQQSKNYRKQLQKQQILNKFKNYFQKELELINRTNKIKQQKNIENQQTWIDKKHKQRAKTQNM